MIYFDNAATTFHKPQEVIDAITKALTTMGNAGRGGNLVSIDSNRAIFNARENVAKFFNIANSSRVAFTSNSTEALNIAIKGLITPSDHIITTVLEHNSVLRPLYEMEKLGTKLTFIEADKMGNVKYEDIEKNILPNTKAIVCTHNSNLTGNSIDINKISDICKKHNLVFILDASQSAGIFPIDVTSPNIDILCFTGHKSLYGPQGTGGIYVKEGINLKPLKSGGTGIMTFEKEQPLEMPTHLEAGTLNGHGIVGLSAGIDFINKIGIANIRAHEHKLMQHFYEGVKDIEGVTIYGDFSNPNRSPIVTLNIKDYSSGDVEQELLETYGICTRAGGHCAPLMHKALHTEIQGAVRFSFSYFNTIEEIECAITAIKNIANM